MNPVPRFICIFSSLSIAIWIYAINNNITIACLLNLIASFFPQFSVDSLILDSIWLGKWVSYPLFFVIIFGVAYLTTTLFNKVRSHRDVTSEEIKSISVAGEDMFFTYFGLFFYALSVKGLVTLTLTFLLLCLGLCLATIYVFNPLYLFLGYKFYKVQTESKTILVLSKQTYEYDDNVSFERLVSITPFTFVELK